MMSNLEFHARPESQRTTPGVPKKKQPGLDKRDHTRSPQLWFLAPIYSCVSGVNCLKKLSSDSRDPFFGALKNVAPTDTLW